MSCRGFLAAPLSLGWFCSYGAGRRPCSGLAPHQKEATMAGRRKSKSSRKSSGACRFGMVKSGKRKGLCKFNRPRKAKR